MGGGRSRLVGTAVPDRPVISVVVPCFDEQDALPEFLRRMGAVLDAAGCSSEIVVVDDGSTDMTWAIALQAATGDPRIVAIRLMRNHGHQLALTAGLSLCRGDRILIIDADLQDPPELLPEMMALMDHGADVVYGQRRERAGESFFKRTTANLFYRILSHVAEVDIPRDAGDFRLITRGVLSVLIAMPERHRFIRGMIAWIGGVQVALIYDRAARVAGESKYPFTKMFRFAADAVTGFSLAPLKLSTKLGWLTAAVGFFLAVYSSVGALLGHTVPGWSSLMAAVCLLSGMQFLILGVFGSYLGRLYEQSKARPLYIIRETVGLSENSWLALSAKEVPPPLRGSPSAQADLP